METVAIGIDLGTSTSEVAMYRADGPMVFSDPIWKSQIIPSLVAISETGQILVGEDARGSVDLPGKGIREAKRKMGTEETVELGGNTYRPEEISSLVLRKVRKVAEENLGRPIEEAVITVPANFPDAARQATLNAAHLAGITVLRLINEPTAAALAFGISNIDVEEQLVVFDFGGGTLDVTTLEMMSGVLEVKSSFGDTQLGGKDFDEAMIDLILNKFAEAGGNPASPDSARRDLKQPAENAKKELSKRDEAEVRIPRFGFRNGDLIDLQVKVTRSEFEAALEPLLERARDVLRQALSAKKLRPSSINRILLVGGTTYVPAVRDLIVEFFGKEGTSDVHPDLAVAMGASVQAAMLKGLVPTESGLVATDVSAFGLGIDIVSRVGDHMVTTYEPLIMPNTTVPYFVKRPYTLLHADQRSVKFQVYQDHTGKAVLPEDAVDTGLIGHITDIPPNPSGEPHPIEIDFSYGTDGLVLIRAFIPGLNRETVINFSSNALRMSSEEMDLSLKRLNEQWGEAERPNIPAPNAPPEEAWRAHPKAKRYEGLLKRAEKVAAEHPGAMADDLRQAAEDLKSALAASDDGRIENCSDKVTDLIFDIESA